MNVRSFLPYAGLFLALVPGLAGCGNPPAETDTGPPEVSVSRPVERPVTDYDTFTGRVEPVESVELRARVPGHLIKVAFKDGAEVTKGELLFEIDPRPYKAALDLAEADKNAMQARAKQASLEFRRIEVLAAKGAATREELEAAIGKRDVSAADVAKADAAVEKAKLDLEYTKITAPINGRTSRTALTVGNLVNAGGGETLLTTLVSLEPMYVYFDVDERSLLHYLQEDAKASGKPQQTSHIKDLKIPVYLGLANEEGYPHKGVIDFADNQVDPHTGTIRVRGVFPNADKVLVPGLFARVRVQAGDPYKALLVTDRAIGTNQGQKYVCVVDAAHKVSERPVKLGSLEGGLRVILEGLTPDDWVIVNGMQRVREGVEVKRKETPMPGLAPSTGQPPVVNSKPGEAGKK